MTVNSNVGHVELARSRLARYWSPGGGLVRDLGYSRYADFGIKASLAAVSLTLLLNAETPVEKIVFGVTTTGLGVILIASAIKTFGG